MRHNHLKQKLQAGGTSIGTFMFEFATTGIGRLAAEAGAEFAIYDMEHTGWSVETIRMLIATTRATEMIPLVRIPATEYDFVARILDMGAMGIMIPMCESAAQAQKFVASAKYPPFGRRGAAFTIAHDGVQVAGHRWLGAGPELGETFLLELGQHLHQLLPRRAAFVTRIERQFRPRSQSSRSALGTAGLPNCSSSGHRPTGKQSVPTARRAERL